MHTIIMQSVPGDFLQSQMKNGACKVGSGDIHKWGHEGNTLHSLRAVTHNYVQGILLHAYS